MNEPETPHPPRKRSVRKTVPKKKKAPEFTVVSRPGERYAIQKAFVKKGIYLINPANYKYLNGYFNASALYLTLVPPPPPCPEEKALGFLPQDTPLKKEDDQVPNELQIDATLYFSYPNDDYILGLGIDKIYYVVIQTWHDAEIEKWEKIAQEVALDLSTNEDGSITQRVKFFITSTFLPNDPDAPHQLILKLKSQYRSSAVSQMSIDPYEEDFYDE